jgi:hypothetical protein
MPAGLALTKPQMFKPPTFPKPLTSQLHKLPTINLDKSTQLHLDKLMALPTAKHLTLQAKVKTLHMYLSFLKPRSDHPSPHTKYKVGESSERLIQEVI